MLGHVYLVISDRDVRVYLVQLPRLETSNLPAPWDCSQSHQAPLCGMLPSVLTAVTICSDCHTVRGRLEKSLGLAHYESQL